MATFWTNQTIEAWNEALNKGYLVGNPDYIWEEFKEPYHWMMEQMKKRLHYYNGEYPIWVWTEKPDLRRSGHFNRGTYAVRLQVEMPSEHVLLSDFDAWHMVLNDGFLPLTWEEDELYDKGQSKRTKEESWERIFELEQLRKSELWNNSEQWLQGVTGRVNIKQVKKVTEFIAK
jgi:hypothetical protein